MANHLKANELNLGDVTLKKVSMNATTGVTGSGSAGIECSGIFKATKVFNAVWNDIADAITFPNTNFEFGYCYVYDGKECRKSKEYGERGILGIHSDTAGYILGIKNDENQLICAIGGFVLAYVDKEYESGTPLTCAEGGMLTEATPDFISKYPYKIVGTFFRKEESEEYNGIKVNNRCWIKIK